MTPDTARVGFFEGLAAPYRQGGSPDSTCVRGTVAAPAIDRPWPLLGRDAALSALEAHVRMGSGGVVVAGSAGVGKTRLLREVAASRGSQCRFVTATVSASAYSLGVFAEFLPGSTDAAERRRCVVDAVTAGCRLLVIDDAHLLDEDSAQVVADVVGGEYPTVVVLGIRTGEAMPAPISRTVREIGAGTLDVGPLSKQATIALVEHALRGRVERATAHWIWSRCRGNPLYLSQFLRDVVRRGRFTRRGDVWFWNGDATLSATMVDLLESSVGRPSSEVRAVLDVLAICNPVEESVLVSVAGTGAVRNALAAEAITIEDAAPGRLVRLAHPMLGELRRCRAGTLGLRRLSGRVADGLKHRRDPASLVRRALLVMNSDIDPEVGELLRAADAALELGDMTAAHRISRAAVRAGGGAHARRALARALICDGRFADALGVLDDSIRPAADERERLVAAMTRAAVLTHLDRAGDAHRELHSMREAAVRLDLVRPYGSVYAYVLAARGCPRAAARLAVEALDAPGWSDESFDLVARLAAVIALGDSGRSDRLAEIVATGPPDAVRALLDVYHLRACQFAGLTHRAREVADGLDAGPTSPAVVTHRAFGRGMAALTNGDLAAARRWLTEAAAAVTTLECVRLASLVEVWLAATYAMAGDPGRARDVLARLAGAGEGTWQAHKTILVRAWIAAAEGSTSEAIELAQRAAEVACAHGQLAYEVVCLQVAVQFGDTTAVERLAVLAARVEGPRAVTASAHARALRAHDGDELLRVSTAYADFGDRIAAADAAAQAAVAFRTAGRRGSVLTASKRAETLARECGADTPAQRCVAAPDVLTSKQLEIITLVDRGLSNREIADLLGASVRTVEGHLLRAYRRTGATSRAELCGMVHRKG